MTDPVAEMQEYSAKLNRGLDGLIEFHQRPRAVVHDGEDAWKVAVLASMIAKKMSHKACTDLLAVAVDRLARGNEAS